MSSDANGWPVRWALLRQTSGRRTGGGAGYVLVIGGFALAVVALFAFPLEHVSPDLDVGFSELRRLSRLAESGRVNPDGVTKFSGFWWSSGLLLATCALAVLVAALAAGVQRAAFALALALVAGATSGAQVYATLHTARYELMFSSGAPADSLFTDATAAPGAALAGLAAVVVGGLWLAIRFTGRAGRRASAAPLPPGPPALPTAR